MRVLECWRCKRPTIHEDVAAVRHRRHMAATVLTLGLWLPVWIAAAIWHRGRERWACLCGASQSEEYAAHLRTLPPDYYPAPR